MSQELGQVQPGVRGSVTGLDGGPELALGGCAVFLALRDAPGNVVGHGGIEGRHCLRLSAGFVFASADDAGGGEIKLRQVDTSFHISRIEFDGALELDANFFCEARRGKKSCTVGLLSIDAAQPKMIEAVLRIEIARAFASRNAAVP